MRRHKRRILKKRTNVRFLVSPDKMIPQTRPRKCEVPHSSRFLHNLEKSCNVCPTVANCGWKNQAANSNVPLKLFFRFFLSFKQLFFGCEEFNALFIQLKSFFINPFPNQHELHNLSFLLDDYILAHLVLMSIGS